MEDVVGFDGRGGEGREGKKSSVPLLTRGSKTSQQCSSDADAGAHKGEKCFFHMDTLIILADTE